MTPEIIINKKEKVTQAAFNPELMQVYPVQDTNKEFPFARVRPHLQDIWSCIGENLNEINPPGKIVYISRMEAKRNIPELGLMQGDRFCCYN